MCTCWLSPPSWRLSSLSLRRDGEQPHQFGGSWWRVGQWGYKCCHQLLKNSYSTGQAGTEVSDSTFTLPLKKDEEEVVEEKQRSGRNLKRKRGV